MTSRLIKKISKEITIETLKELTDLALNMSPDIGFKEAILKSTVEELIEFFITNGWEFDKSVAVVEMRQTEELQNA